MRIGFELTGEMPLLMHADDVEQSDAVALVREELAKLDNERGTKGTKRESKGGDDRTPPWTWQTYLYTDGEYVTMPMDNIMSMLKTAATRVIYSKQKTFKELSQSGLAYKSLHAEFLVGGKPIAVADLPARTKTFAEQAQASRDLGFALFCKRAKVGQSKHVRVRPRFESWVVRGELLVTDERISFENVREFFRIAETVGLCDWRPSSKQSPGPYGTFKSKVTKL